MFIFAGEPDFPIDPPILTSKYGSVTAGDQFYLEGLDTIIIIAYRASRCFWNYDDPKSVNEQEKSRWYIVQTSPAIPHTERASQQITRKQQLPKHWSPPD